MRRDDVDERVDEAIEEMRSGHDELEERRDELERKTEQARQAAKRGRDATANTDTGGDEPEDKDEDVGRATAEEGDAVDDASSEEG